MLSEDCFCLRNNPSSVSDACDIFCIIVRNKNKVNHIVARIKYGMPSSWHILWIYKMQNCWVSVPFWIAFLLWVRHHLYDGRSVQLLKENKRIRFRPQWKTNSVRVGTLRELAATWKWILSEFLPTKIPFIEHILILPNVNL